MAVIGRDLVGPALMRAEMLLYLNDGALMSDECRYNPPPDVAMGGWWGSSFFKLFPSVTLCNSGGKLYNLFDLTFEPT